MIPYDNLSSLDLLNRFLGHCNQITGTILTKTKMSKASSLEIIQANHICDACNTMVSIYYFRSCKTPEEALRRCPKEYRDCLGKILNKKWEVLQNLSSTQLAELAINTLQLTSAVLEVDN